MATNGQDPVVPGLYRLTLGGKEAALFRKVSGIGAEVAVVEAQINTPQGTPEVRKVPGAAKFTDLKLEKGITEDNVLYEWWKQTESGDWDSGRVDGMVELCDTDLSPIQVYSFKQGWIKDIEGPKFNAQDNQLAIETVTIVHEGLDRVS